MNHRRTLRASLEPATTSKDIDHETVLLPGSCSLAIHIVLREANVPHELAKVDLWQHKTASGGDYFQINPKGTAPALEFEGGLLTEGAAISQYLADRYAPTLVPANGTLERSRLHEILNYLSSDYHKSFTPLFYLSPSDDPTAAQPSDSQSGLPEQPPRGRPPIHPG